MELRGADGGALHSILAQPKRQGLLAYLAVAVPRGYHRRDTLVGLLWPDRNEEQARASLSKAVSHLRQTLGADALISRGHAELGLDWQRVWCDAAGFEESLDRGALAEAMALYQGELLPGFHIDEAPEFGQWLERERARLRGRAVQAARILSEQEEGAGHIGVAIEWGRRAASLEPLDESVVRRVMSLLERSADRAGALRAYDEFARRLRSELDVAPASETVALMATIRDREIAAPIIAARAEPAPRGLVAAPVTPAPRPPTVLAIRPTRRWGIAIPAALAVFVLAGWALVGRLPQSASASSDNASVAVLPFVQRGVAGSVSDNLGEAMVTLISERLNHSGVLRAIDSRAARSVGQPLPPQASAVDSARTLVARFNPRFVLLGEITAQGDSLVINAALFDSTARQPVARASVAGSADDLARLAADLSGQLLAVKPTRREPLWERSPAVLTPSVPALRAFLAAEKHYGAGQYVEAAKHYKAAVDADTTFALAYLYLARSANWAGDYTMETFATQRAVEHVDRLSPIDQFLVKAWDAYLHAKPLEAERLGRLIVVNEQGMMDAWYVLGEVRFHWGPILGWTRDEAREGYERATTIAITAGGLVHLARIAAAQGRPASVDSLVRRALALGADHPQSLELRALRAHTSRDRGETERVQAAIASLDDNAAFSVVTQVAAHAAEYPSARAVPEALRQPRRAALLRASGAMLSAQLAMAHGRVKEAEGILTAGPDLTAARALEYRAALAIVPFRRVSADELTRLRDDLRGIPRQDFIGPTPAHYATDAIYRVRHRYLLAMLALKTGDIPEADRIANELAASDDGSRHNGWRGPANLVRAELLRAKGQPAAALEALGEPREFPTLPNVMDYSAAHDRFLRAELYRELGRNEEALRWYGTFPDPGAYDLMYLAPVHLGTGAVHERRGDRDAARASYQRAIALWSGADADFTPMVAAARERLAILNAAK